VVVSRSDYWCFGEIRVLNAVGLVNSKGFHRGRSRPEVVLATGLLCPMDKINLATLLQLQPIEKKHIFHIEICLRYALYCASDNLVGIVLASNAEREINTAPELKLHIVLNNVYTTLICFIVHFIHYFLSFLVSYYPHCAVYMT